MSSTQCPKCKSIINSTTIKCPNCGYLIKDNPNTSVNNSIAPKKPSNGCGIALLFIFGFLILFFLIKQCSKTEDKIDYSSKLDTKLLKKDSIKNQARIDSIDKQQKIEEEKFSKTKAGKIHKKHPEWSKEDCINISEHKIWIGMKYEMLVYMRGKPNNVNTSNYGNGPNYQACWNDYDPSCFYFDESQIITSYN
ncbi:hypothetical protein [Chryseobacterium limigenitum]|uniref:Zinc-ribbon domain-containing protein n=1 Tax=Chryseobacterium limigenitum TaxID=1612149 RepID=A0A1K2IP63_9FLAO|nr:hypothetical protein [Chryseobacterium limigenitum]SFZ94225.1 hypothetical protein SAMN05216324_106157 [Chryseobacterium limigenitum]